MRKNIKIKLIHLYKIEWDFIKKDLKPFIKFVIASLGILFIIFVICFYINDSYFSSVIDNFVKRNINPNNKNYIIFNQIYTNNVLISFFEIIIGGFSFFIIPVIGLISDSFLFALIFVRVTKYLDLNTLMLIIPHGILESLEIIYSVSVSFYLSFQFVKKIFFRSKMPFSTIIKRALKSFFFISVPSLFIAAIIETYFSIFLYKYNLGLKLALYLLVALGVFITIKNFRNIPKKVIVFAIIAVIIYLEGVTCYEFNYGKLNKSITYECLGPAYHLKNGKYEPHGYNIFGFCKCGYFKITRAYNLVPYIFLLIYVIYIIYYISIKDYSNDETLLK